MNKSDFTSFGTNNYSGKMELVTIPPGKTSIEELLRLRGFYLNPFVEPNSLEIFGLFGTTERFLDWYKSGLESYATKKAVKVYGLNFDDKKVNQRRRDMIELEKAKFTPWYKR